MSQAATETKYGTIEFQGKDFATPSFLFDRLAISGRGELLLVSLVAPSQNIKQIRAILNGGAKAQVMAGGVKVNQPGREAWYAHAPGRLTPSADGYQTLAHKIGYGQVHALFVTRTPGFMKVVTGETLWQELNDVRFTTPLLREWVPHIEKCLRDESLLEDAHVYNCTCGVLSASTRHLDTIVTEGLQSGALSIPRPAHVA
jgi:hypothetical protein